jgi:hypothetical protein
MIKFLNFGDIKITSRLLIITNELPKQLQLNLKNIKSSRNLFITAKTFKIIGFPLNTPDHTHLDIRYEAHNQSRAF